MLHDLITRIKQHLTPAPPPLPTGMVEVQRQGMHLQLDMNTWLGREMYRTGVFEPLTLKWMDQLIQPGMNVLDVGANIGYFTTIMAQRVAPGGHVWAFEPTQHYGQRVNWHLQHNGVAEHVTLLPIALSDAPGSLDIAIGDSSATIHPLAEDQRLQSETITLRPLDDVVDELDLPKIDFVKVDVDGHEPKVLAGGERFFRTHRPTLLIEFFQGNLDAAGSDVRELRDQVEALGYQLCSEKTGKPFADRWSFLEECGNFTHSVNVLALPKQAAASGNPARAA